MGLGGPDAIGAWKPQLATENGGSGAALPTLSATCTFRGGRRVELQGPVGARGGGVVGREVRLPGSRWDSG